MTHIPLILFLTAFACYASSFLHTLTRVWKKQQPNKLWVMSILTIGVLCHIACLSQQLYTPYGLDLNIFNVLSFTGWLMLALTLIFCTYRPILSLLLLAIPMATGGLIVAQFFYVTYIPAPLSLGLTAHILTSITAYCLFLMASLHAVLLWFQHTELKHQSQNRLWVAVLPPLQTMESLLFDMIYSGFALLTLALILGAIYVDNLLAQHLIHKTVFSVLSWLIFAVLIIGRVRFGWRGMRAVRFTLIGFFSLFLGFLGSKFVLELLLHRVG